MSIFADSESNTPTPPESANDPTISGSAPPPASRGLQHGTGSGPTLIEWMALVAGLAVAFALFGELLRSDDNEAAWHVWPLAILGGFEFADALADHATTAQQASTPRRDHSANLDGLDTLGVPSDGPGLGCMDDMATCNGNEVEWAEDQ
ncbi:hypothetical protein Isop_3085 [Isosphaera pallida ATCC 43644]|uniref:Uncharacterized protein n=1 Tax=Isosphaera pallida (strain ATCC 43644 / DSM 9630 / IS1B) TaxID=575540 RepID=E8R3E0_ISOPI|nr:hypothetical protein [Isosphaera pallida]ADV63650.1 hypothetical protein Isop_3085 [Isosphaera pallida ATCC 43644]